MKIQTQPQSQPVIVKEQTPFWTKQRIAIATVAGLSALAAVATCYSSSSSTVIPEVNPESAIKIEPERVKDLTAPVEMTRLEAFSSVVEDAVLAARQGTYGPLIKQVVENPATTEPGLDTIECRRLLTLLNLIRTSPDYGTFTSKLAEVECSADRMLPEADFLKYKQFPFKNLAEEICRSNSPMPTDSARAMSGTAPNVPTMSLKDLRTRFLKWIINAGGKDVDQEFLLRTNDGRQRRQLYKEYYSDSEQVRKDAEALGNLNAGKWGNPNYSTRIEFEEFIKTKEFAQLPNDQKIAALNLAIMHWPRAAQELLRSGNLTLTPTLAGYTLLRSATDRDWKSLQLLRQQPLNVKQITLPDFTAALKEAPQYVPYLDGEQDRVSREQIRTLRELVKFPLVKDLPPEESSLLAEIQDKIKLAEQQKLI